MAQVLSTANQLSFPSRISARGIIGGVLVALAIDMLLFSFGAAIGLSAFKPGGAGHGAAIWAVIWFFISVSAGGFFGGWVGAAAGGAKLQRDGILHGFVTWAAATVLAGMFLLGFLARTANVAATAAGAVSQAAPTAGQTAQQNIPNVTPQQLRGTLADSLGLSTWAMFLGMALALGFALGGGALAAGLERRSLEERRGVEVTQPGGTLPVA